MIILVVGGIIALIALAFLNMGEPKDQNYSLLPQGGDNTNNLGKSKEEIANEIEIYILSNYPNSLFNEVEGVGFKIINAGNPTNIGSGIGVNPIIIMAIAEVETGYASSDSSNYLSETNNPFNERDLIGECNSDGENSYGDIIDFNSLDSAISEEAIILFNNYLNCGGTESPIENIQIKRSETTSWLGRVEAAINNIEESTSLRYYIFGGISDEVPGPLREVFVEVGNVTGTPPALLAAFSSRECGRLWNVPENELNNWIETESDVDRRGCGYNNGWNCWGPMQFLVGIDYLRSRGMDYNYNRPNGGSALPDVGTWEEYIDDIQLLRDRTNPSMINIKDSVYAAGKKIKSRSGNTGGDWTREQVYAAADDYCGSCTDVAACGGNYCSAIWESYQRYLTIGGSGGGQGDCNSRQECAQKIYGLHSSGKIHLNSQIGDSDSNALQNIIDTKNGVTPKTDAGASVEINTHILKVIYRVSNQYQTLWVNAILGGGHMSGSRHYIGKAVDLDNINNIGNSDGTGGVWNNIISYINNMIDLIIEDVLDDGDHIHVELEP